MAIEVALTLTLDQIADNVRAMNVTPGQPTVWFSQQTVWWTTIPDHRFRLRLLGQLRQIERDPPGSELPDLLVDPKGAPLFEADLFEFIEKAKAAAAVGMYGRHGIIALTAAHSANVIAGLGMPLADAPTSWDEVNDALDRWVARTDQRTSRIIRVH